MRAPGPDEDGDGEKIEGSAQGMMVRLELGDEAHGRCYRLATWRGSEQGPGMAMVETVTGACSSSVGGGEQQQREGGGGAPDSAGGKK
jgi:hypothetical protein